MKRKIFGLLSVILILSTLLSSCGSISSVGKVLNKDLDLTPEIYANAEDLGEFKDYSLVENFTDDYINEEFALFYKSDNDKVSYKILSFRTGSSLKTFTSDLYTFHSFQFIGDAPAFLVSKAVIDIDSINGVTNEERKAELLAVVTQLTSGELDFEEEVIDALDGFLAISHTLYDANGEEVASSNTVDEVTEFADMILFDHVAYSVNEDEGTLQREIDIPEYLELDECDAFNDEYFYVFNNANVTVYNRDFKLIFTWTAPSFIDGGILDDNYSFNVLNNGDILLQYMVIQDDDAKKYDFSFVEDEVTRKVNLVSKLISAKNGKVKDIKLDYLVVNVFTNNDLYDDSIEENENVFTDKFENIATILPIVDKKMLVSQSDTDLVLMNNNARAKKSIKMIDGQVSTWPEKIGDEVYAIPMLDGGISIIKSNGKLIGSMNTLLEQCGSYFVGEKAIYDLTLNKVYDLRENDARVIATMERAVLIRKDTDEGYDIVKLLDGEEKTIYSHNNATSKTSFSAISGDGFYIITEENGEYSYYNQEGVKIVTSQSILTSVASSTRHNALLLGSISESESNYCIFTK